MKLFAFWILTFLVLCFGTIQFSKSATLLNPGCNKIASVIEDHMKEKYGETPANIGLIEDGSMFVILTNTAKNTFTLIHRYPNGLGCIMGFGTDWQGTRFTALGQPL